MDANAAVHGYISESDGTITTFDLHGALSSFPTSINDAGEIAGTYEDEHGSHGFVRDVDGHFSSFLSDHRGQILQRVKETCYTSTALFWIPTATSPLSTHPTRFLPVSINSSGPVTGSYSASSTGKFPFGFVRDALGNITTFRGPGFSNDTFPSDINARGEITGSYVDPVLGVSRGYIRGK